MAWFRKSERISRSLESAFVNWDRDEFRRLLVKHPEFLRYEDGRDRWMQDAAGFNNLDALKLLVELGLDVNDSSSLDFPSTALHRAAAEGNLDIVRWLLDQGAEINHTRNGHTTGTVLRRAVRAGHFDVVKLLVERGADIHGHWHGVNAPMDAEFYGQNEIAAYLRSLGAKDLRETTPPDYAGSRRQLIENMVNRCGPLSNWTIERPGDPPVTIHHIPADPQHQTPPVQTLFTIGLSDHRLPVDGDAFHCTELRIALPPGWPLTDKALADPIWNWPVEWLKRITEELRAAEKLTGYPPLFMNGDPPQPLATNTQLCGWMGLRSSSNHVQMPDCRWISLLDLFPIYAEERDFILSAPEAYEKLAYRFEERNIPLHVDPHRENVAL